MNTRQTFENLAQDAFASVIQKHGYRVVDADDSCVRFESVKSMILLRYDHRRSFEVGVDFCDLENGQPKQRIPFSLAEVFREFGVPNADKLGFLQSSDLSLVHDFLVTAARNLDKFCTSILRGESDAFASLNDRRSREALAYTTQIRIKSVKSRADAAWRAQHYQKFVELLREFEAFFQSLIRRSSTMR